MQDNKIYYKVRWQETWEPEERVMAMCAPLLNEFWKDYYAKTQQQQQQEVRNVQQQAQQQNQRIQQGNNQPIVQTKEQELITHSIADLTTTMLPSAVGNGCPPEVRLIVKDQFTVFTKGHSITYFDSGLVLTMLTLKVNEKQRCFQQLDCFSAGETQTKWM